MFSRMRDFVAALLPFGTSVAVGGVAVAWLLAYRLPIGDPKFVNAPWAFFQLGIYFALFSVLVAIVSGALGVWLCPGRSARGGRATALLVVFGLAYATWPLLYDKALSALPSASGVALILWLLFPAVATWSAIRLTQRSIARHGHAH